MDRLTSWNGKKYVLPGGRTSDGQSYWRIIAERLAAYENTGMTPEEIEQMKILQHNEEPKGRYTVSYDCYLFVGDKDEGINRHEYNSWDEVQSLINAYPDVIRVDDNEYGVTWEKGEWY